VLLYARPLAAGGLFQTPLPEAGERPVVAAVKFELREIPSGRGRYVALKILVYCKRVPERYRYWPWRQKIGVVDALVVVTLPLCGDWRAAEEHTWNWRISYFKG